MMVRGFIDICSRGCVFGAGYQPPGALENEAFRLRVKIGVDVAADVPIVRRPSSPQPEPIRPWKRWKKRGLTPPPATLMFAAR